jgi:hypothetical protein
MSRETEVSLRLTEPAKEIYNKLPAKGKGTWVSDAIIEKSEREKGIIFTEAEEQRIREIVTEVLNVYTLETHNGDKYYIRKE